MPTSNRRKAAAEFTDYDMPREFPSKVEQIGPCTLYLGDSAEIVQSFDPVFLYDAVVSDPPYGGDYNTDYTRFSGGISQSRNFGKGIVGDDKPFDPSPWLHARHVVLWGYQHFASRCPVGSVLFWGKKRDSQIGTFLSDGELAFCNQGIGVYEFRYVWHGFDRQGERGRTQHPTQKPTELMIWCMDRAKVPPAGTVLDPFMGSGTTGIACVQTGRRFIGIEIDETHYETACNRIRRAWQEKRSELPLEAAT